MNNFSIAVERSAMENHIAANAEGMTAQGNSEQEWCSICRIYRSKGYLILLFGVSAKSKIK